MAPPFRMPYRTLLLALLAGLCARTGNAQTYAIESNLLFFGDNSEFTNQFRSGETLLGTSGRILLDVRFNDTVRVRGGLFGSGRYGSHEFLEHAEPAIALELSRGPSRLIFGSLETVAWQRDIAGPDHETPHGLLPPIQQETLTFTRGQEMGLQWLVSSKQIAHDAWINWQRLNTTQFRERFDAGYRGTVHLTSAIDLHGQWHHEHEGGQQFDSGAVRDNMAGALGVQWSARFGSIGLSTDAHAVATRNTPDRTQPALTDAGLGIFSRAALTRGPWRTHLIVWRSRDAVKAEGDANYLSVRRNGTVFRRVRDYGEWGLTRHFRPAPEVHMFASFRLHRTESDYEYSYRIVARVQWRRAL
jgi:hypothetical protein